LTLAVRTFEPSKISFSEKKEPMTVLLCFKS